jgi:hypothetical protein
MKNEIDFARVCSSPIKHSVVILHDIRLNNDDISSKFGEFFALSFPEKFTAKVMAIIIYLF